VAADRPAVEALGAVTVRCGDHAISGNALGGRRARVALVALSLAEQPIPAERLADMVWSDAPPPTWQVALRGIVSGVRTAVAPIGLGEQRLIATTPSGYELATGVQVDVRLLTSQIREGERLLEHERFAAALTEVEAATKLDGAALLPGEDLDWLAPHRQAIDEIKLRALQIETEAAGRLGDHHRSIATARRAVVAAPMDERAHRALIRALERAGDRAGAVAAYEHCRSVLADQLGIDPSRETVDAYLAALSDQSASGSPGRLPAEHSSFVGREAESELLVAALRRPGLITVIGRGGVGKSRIAQHVARRATSFEGGRYWVPLATVSDDELVASSVALGIGARVGADDPARAISRHLAPLGPALLVLDGGELVIDGVASLVSALMTDCPALTILLTSRLPLAVDGERVIAIAPLPKPGSGGARSIVGSAAVQLLADRVRVTGDVLTIDDVTAPLIAELCERCGGLPLALELAAAQLSAIPVGDLLDHLSDVVVDGDQLRAVMRRGHALLDADEAAVFRRFAVLDGAVGLPLIKGVVAGSDIAQVRVVRLLRELTARGLLTVDSSGVRWLYRQDDDVHRFAAELLEESGEARVTFARLAAAVRAMLPDDARAVPAPFEQQISDVVDSVRSMLNASLAGQVNRDLGFEIAFRLHRYWASTNVAEGRFWLSRFLADHPDSVWASFGRYAAGYLSYWLGDSEVAYKQLSAAADTLSDDDGSYKARALIFLGGIADDLDRGAEAVSYVRRAIDSAAAWGVDLQVSAAMGMGCVLAERVDPAAAEFAAEAIEMCRSNGSAEQLAAAMPTAAMVCWQVGAIDAARAFVDEARPMHAGGRRIARVVLLSTAAGVALDDGDVAAAIDYGRSADAEATELGIEREVPLIRTVLARSLLAAGDVTAAAERAVAGLEAARALSYDHPLASSLETAALVVLAEGTAALQDVAVVMAAAADLRRKGSRPVTPTLRAAVEAAGVRLDVAGIDLSDVPVDRGAAVDLGLALLRAVVGRSA
jgi:predicted ATPase/DNA-binding SARP family transcriptional activator